jgi:hypothetical protein
MPSPPVRSPSPMPGCQRRTWAASVSGALLAGHRDRRRPHRRHPSRPARRRSPVRRTISMQGTRPARLRRHPHPSRQGPYLAAEAEPRWHLDGRAARGRRPTANATGRPPMSSGASISHCAAPMPTARRRSARISTRRCRSTRSPGTLFERMRDRWAGRIELQAVSITGPDTLVTPDELDAVARQVKASGGLLGGSVAVYARSKEAMLRVVEKAGELGLDLDLHTDETGDPAAHALLHLAEAVLETGYTGKVMAGHCCVLTVQDERTQKPHHRQGGRGRHRHRVAADVQHLPAGPRSTRTARPHAAPARRDAAQRVQGRRRDRRHRVGQYARPVLRLWRSRRRRSAARRRAHPPFRSPAGQGLGLGARRRLGTRRRMPALPTRPCSRPARQPTSCCSAPASWTELNARPQMDRIVLRAGKAIDTSLPDYRELDDLME